MNNRDDELDALLKPLRTLSPNDLQMQAWQRAVGKQRSYQVIKVTRSRMVFQMVAAMFIGAVIGGAIMRGFYRERSGSQLLVQNSFASATFENSHANLD